MSRTSPVAPQRKLSTVKGDVLRLASGTGIAQLIGILSAPILSRLYAPEAFGLVALYISLVAIISVIACLRYELSIVLPEDDREAANLLGSSLLASLLIAATTFLAVWIGGPGRLAAMLNAADLQPFLWMVPFGVLIQGVFLALNQWNSRTRHFTRLSIARVTSATCTTSVQLGAGAAGYATGGTMILANICGQAVATAILGGQIVWNHGRYFVDSMRWEGILAGIKRYRKFPLLSTWSGLLNTASWQLPTLMLGAFFSASVVGFYALGFRILQLPMNLLGGAIGQVFLQRAAEARTDGTLAHLVDRLFQRLVTIGLLPVLMLALIGEDVYVVVFGDAWAEAGVYTQILSVWAFVWFISAPLARLFFVLEKQEFSLQLNLVIFATRLAALGTGGYFQNIYLALGLYAATGFVLYGYQVLVVLRLVGISPAAAWRTISRSLLYFAPCGLALLGLKVLDAGSPIIVSCASLLMAGHMAIVFRKELRALGHF